MLHVCASLADQGENPATTLPPVWL